MAPKGNTRAGQGAAGPPPSDGASAKRFEAELEDLASKAKSGTAGGQTLNQLSTYAKVAALASLLGIYSNASQLTLSPVYGTIPSSVYHSKLLIAGCFVGWAGNLWLQRVSPVPTAQLLPLLAFCIPTIQFLLCQYSDALALPWGPLVTEGLTLLPLSALTASSVADALFHADLSVLPGFIADAAPGIGSWALFKLVEDLSSTFLMSHVGRAFIYTRMGLEMLLASSYAVLAPSKYLLLTIPALLHTAFLNTHVATPQALALLNKTLATENWLLLDRRESLTGYVSVLENLDRGFRVMRCDHSLLGGEWTMFQGERISEPIYGVFVMLEAVRLVETRAHVEDNEAKALVIGLGVGTTPSAFVLHGIDTTVVEIDPVVHEFATKHFNLRQNHEPALVDAVSHTKSLVESGQAYDYIVHDVFTGGAEPIDLFTLEFLQGLSALLKPNGVIAINYAGDFALPTPRIIVRTILEVFPTCRIFRESPAKAADGDQKDQSPDFTNMVIFCTKSTSEPLKFRRPAPADFLHSRARQMFLEPKHEVEQLQLLAGGGGGDEYGMGILRRNETDKVAEWHKKSASGHWAVMRTVVPARIWEMW